MSINTSRNNLAKLQFWLHSRVSYARLLSHFHQCTIDFSPPVPSQARPACPVGHLLVCRRAREQQDRCAPADVLSGTRQRCSWHCCARVGLTQRQRSSMCACRLDLLSQAGAPELAARCAAGRSQATRLGRPGAREKAAVHPDSASLVYPSRGYR